MTKHGRSKRSVADKQTDKLSDLEFVRLLGLVDETASKQAQALHRIVAGEDTNYWRSCFVRATVASWAVGVVGQKKLLLHKVEMWGIHLSPMEQEILRRNKSSLDKIANLRVDLWEPSFLEDVVATLDLVFKYAGQRFELDRESPNWSGLEQTLGCAERLAKGGDQRVLSVSLQDVNNALSGDTWFTGIMQALGASKPKGIIGLI